MFERFTDRARRVVVLAQEEARSFRHNYIGSEHVLLGLFAEGEGIAAKALDAQGVDRDQVAHKVVEIIGRGDSPTGGHIPFTPGAKQTLELSLQEAFDLGHEYIGTEHILLGVIDLTDSVAVNVLLAVDTDLDALRNAVHQLIATMPQPPARPRPSGWAGNAGGADRPSCPGCRQPTDELGLLRRVVEDQDDGEVNLIQVFCGRCGTTLGVLPGSSDSNG